MAEGGDFGYDDPDLDYQIDHDDDDDDDQEVNRTQPFQPGAASTPYHGGEHHEMQTMMHEQSGLPDTSYEETPLLEPEERQSKLDSALNFIKSKFPKADFKRLGPIGFSKKGARADIVSFGPRGGKTKIFKNDGSFQKNFIDRFSKSLGPSAEEIIAQDRDTIQEQQQRLVEAERQQREADIIAAQRDEESREIQNLRLRTERVQSQIDALQEEQGSNLESETELNRLKQLKKNYEKDLEIKKKKLGALQKEAKSKDKAQAKVDRERAKLAQIEKDRNEIEKRLNSTKAVDELKEQESELKCQKEEDQAAIQDENTSPSEREAAEARVAERNEGLSRLRTQIEEREAGMPLRERIREIFKKYGVTMTAIFIAAGITITAVVGSITKALKATGKAIGNGLKDIGAKIGSLLPGLIGSVVSFLFKTAGQAIGFLAEHTWLLILAAVVFIFEKYIKKRR